MVWHWVYIDYHKLRHTLELYVTCMCKAGRGLVDVFDSLLECSMENKAFNLAGPKISTERNLVYDHMQLNLAGHCRKLHGKWPMANCYLQLWDYGN